MQFLHTVDLFPLTTQGGGHSANTRALKFRNITVGCFFFFGVFFLLLLSVVSALMRILKKVLPCVKSFPWIKILTVVVSPIDFYCSIRATWGMDFGRQQFISRATS